MILPYYPDPDYIRESIKNLIRRALQFAIPGRFQKTKELVISLKQQIRSIRKSLHIKLKSLSLVLQGRKVIKLIFLIY